MDKLARVIEIFKEISQVPHCSGNTDALKDYIMEFAMDKCYIVLTDKTNNILVKKEDASLAFQAHYDMVCVGDAPKLNIYEKDGFIHAKNSSLGSDNGIGVAMMLYLIENDYNAEYLFTSDEEIGLIGASHITLDLVAKYMINLDSEEENGVFIGCAGGVEVIAKKELTYLLAPHKNTYKLTIDGLPGGHSGVDIDKKIPNAIKALSLALQTLPSHEIINLHGGVAPNAIPSSAFALINTEHELSSTDIYRIEKIEDLIDPLVIKDSHQILSMIDTFPYGVLEQETTLPIPKTSTNIGILNIDNNILEFVLFPRSMENKALKELEEKLVDICQSYQFKTTLYAPYPAWTPQADTFANKVLELSQKVIPDSHFQAIHAGLECGIIKDKFPHIQVVSIGPNIYNPHSTREKIEIASVEKIMQVVDFIIDEYK